MKKNNVYHYVLFSFLALGQVSCSQAPPKEKTSFKVDEEIQKFWQQGKAEVSVYELQQNRYRELHPGQLVSIFVREDFLTDKQVKNDNYKNPNSVPVLKNIQLRKFPTGIYDYSVFTSTFTPFDRETHPQTLKVTSSSQEWCGNTFLQLNSKAKGYSVQLRSYFENEGDQNTKIDGALLEDELFNLLRLNPNALPQGKSVKVIPSAFFVQLKHVAIKPYEASLSVSDYSGNTFSGNKLKAYHISYPVLDRKLSIVYEDAFPYKILGWTDAYPSISDGQMRSTVVKLKKSERLKYWGMNKLSDLEWRSKMHLD